MRFSPLDSSDDFMGRGGLRFSLSLILSELWCHQWRHNDVISRFVKVVVERCGTLLYQPPFTDDGKIWCSIVDPRYTLTCQNSSRSVYSVALGRRKPQFLPFFGLRHLVMSPIRSSLIESWTWVHNDKPSPIQRYQNRFCTLTPSWRNRVHNLWRSKAWRTNRQTDKNSTFLAARLVGEIRAPPNLTSSTFLHI